MHAIFSESSVSERFQTTEINFTVTDIGNIE